MIKDYIMPQKSELNRISISSFDGELPDLKNTSETKAVLIGKWLILRIKNALKSGEIHENDLLPLKSEFAYLLGVSVGTIQHALRYIEDLGYAKSKQCIGTLVKNPKNSLNPIRKLTSKREMAIYNIKKYIIDKKLKIGSKLPSSRIIASAITSSPNTAGLALEFLAMEGILKREYKNSNDSVWMVKSLDFNNEADNNEYINKTLVKKVEEDLKNYISDNLTVGDKMPAHDELASTFKVSIKTIHDALKSLIDEGILLARRGRYGTTVIKMPYDRNYQVKKETSIFAPAQDTAFYYYEKTQNHIKKLISQNYEIGSKLPSIAEFSKQLDLSPNTVRKAFHNLSREGYIVFSRGRYGGTFVVDIPDSDEQSFKWLAVNSKCYARSDAEQS